MITITATDTWRDQAACIGSPDLFFVSRGDRKGADEARRICASCPVIDPCREYATRTNQAFGIWGGLTERQRRRKRAGSGWQSRYEEALKKDGGWVSTVSIANAFGVSYQSAYRRLLELSKRGRLERRTEGDQMEWRAA